ncbi:probable transcription factor At1g11510 [Cornus florida]|uniref:probable transcription factor At1g11510 n=1 Tax=Cornus florida TaxID=4283 RepID=UPI00289E4F43|nr:probable transcription factor At1g11510 [Cornus florida]
MAPTRRLEHDAQHSSSSEEEEEESRENVAREDSESEEEEEDKRSPPTPPKDKKASALKKPEATEISAQTLQSSSSDESGSESDSGTDKQISLSRRADPNIKPISSKPMEETPKATKKPRSKPSVTVKRPLEEKSNQKSKKAKKKRGVGDGVIEEDAAKKTGDDTKKQLFQRLWSEEDEIAVLNGMIEYTAKKRADPLADMNAFHNFIKNKLHIDVSKAQLSEKVRRLKKKYENNASKGKKGGERNITKPHEQKAYELSKRIWGGEANSIGVVSPKVNEKEKKNQNLKSSRAAPSPILDANSDPEVQNGEAKVDGEQKAKPARLFQFSKSIDSSLEDEIIRDGLELIGGSKRLELEEKWKQLRVEEVELYLKRVELVREQTKHVLAVLKSPEH